MTRALIGQCFGLFGLTNNFLFATLILTKTTNRNRTEGDAMYYVIKTTYVGPNPDQHLNDDTIDIATQPQQGNSDPYPVITDGWCGTTNEWSREAFGAHETLASARAKVHEITEGHYRPHEPDEFSFEGGCEIQDMQDFGIVERYRVGLRPQWDAEDSWSFASPVKDEITHETTNKAINALTEEVADILRDEFNAELDTDAVYRMLIEIRDDAVDEVREATE